MHSLGDKAIGAELIKKQLSGTRNSDRSKQRRRQRGHSIFHMGGARTAETGFLSKTGCH